MSPWLPTFVSIAIISAVSLVGLLAIPFRVFRGHAAVFTMIALAAGTLIGDAFFHLIPEGVELWGGFPVRLGGLVVAGFLAFYVLESILRIGHAHAESHHATHGAAEEGAKIQPFGLLNLTGDAVHNFLDGIVVAAAFLVDVPTGVATALAVAIHEIPQEFGDFAVLLRAGFRPIQAAAFNLLSAVFAFLGAGLMLALPLDTDTLNMYALPLVAGGFVYIAAADLVPELHHHTKPRMIPAVLLLLLGGLGLMAGLTLLE